MCYNIPKRGGSMKLTRYPQSCLWIETKDVKILIDPGNIKMQDGYCDFFREADAVFITHKHADHCSSKAIQKIMEYNKDMKLYSTKEVQDFYEELNITIVKEGDVINVGEVKVEVVHAVHGYLPPMKHGSTVMENVGYIVDDGETRLYATSDTLCFQNDYQCDVLCIGISGYGVTMGAFEAALFAKETGAKLVIPVHLDNPKYPIDYKAIQKQMDQQEVRYKLLAIGESVEL